MPPMAVRMAEYLREAKARLARTAAEYAPEPKPSSRSSELGNSLKTRVWLTHLNLDAFAN